MEIVAEIHYDRGRPIGAGQGMNSTVYLASDPQLGGTFAVKEIPKTRLGNNVSRYFAEAQAMFATSHPNIVPIQYACQTMDDVVLAMPYFAKGSLASCIEANPITPEELVRVAQDVLRGLGRIHETGFIHFDLKPSNVFFGRTGGAMVADFGQARQVAPDGTVQVPPMYFSAVPPEVWKSGVGSHLSDIYQAGLLLYRAVNGNPFYEHQLAGLTDTDIRRKILAGRLPDPKAFLPHVPMRLRTIIRKALRQDPSERYQSAAEFAAAVGRVRVSLNWVTLSGPSTGMTWRVSRPEATNLEVVLVPSGPSYDVQVWTVGTSRRAKNRGDYWRNGLSRREAVAHLNEVFGDLNAL